MSDRLKSEYAGSTPEICEHLLAPEYFGLITGAQNGPPDGKLCSERVIPKNGMAVPVFHTESGRAAELPPNARQINFAGENVASECEPQSNPQSVAAESGFCFPEISQVDWISVAVIEGHTPCADSSVGLPKVCVPESEFNRCIV